MVAVLKDIMVDGVKGWSVGGLGRLPILSFGPLGLEKKGVSTRRE